jgi:ABC-2 type transport system ATP-binding protein
VNGLDPDGIVWIRGLMRSLAAEGRAVLVSSHLMGELEGTAAHLIAVGRGRVIADTSVAKLLAAASKDRVEVTTGQRGEATTVLANAGATVAVGGAETVVVDGLSGDRVAALLTSAGIPFSELRRHRASLEEAYMDLTRGALEFVPESDGGAR